MWKIYFHYFIFVPSFLSFLLLSLSLCFVLPPPLPHHMIPFCLLIGRASCAPILPLGTIFQVENSIAAYSTLRKKEVAEASVKWLPAFLIVVSDKEKGPNGCEQFSRSWLDCKIVERKELLIPPEYKKILSQIAWLLECVSNETEMKEIWERERASF